ncbi:MAG: hypothetical protein PHH47_07465 [Gallionella sp.]|nr:hypothetical protein [Gallionella sp.]MDD4945373.1 hypothetical protein [Gallionella sp.]MDD5612436.1 hypothetical protein [Gallionella sp.]
MNTKQLIVLWYVAFVVLWLLAIDGLGIEELRQNDSARLALTAILFGGLVIFTQKSSLQFDKKQFFKWMSIPMLILIGLIALIVNHEVKNGEQKSPSAQAMELLAP